MTNQAGNILIVDDDPDVLNAGRLFLKQHVARVDTESDPQSLPNLLRNNNYDVVLLDMNFTEDVSSGKEGFRWLQKIQEIDPSVAVVFITAYGDVEKAVQAIKKGATDFVLKPWQNEKLLATVNSAMNLARSQREVETLRNRQKVISDDAGQHYQEMIGDSEPMMRVYETIEKVADTDANILILGENGTGKELVARAIHRRSDRSDEVFINVDMGAIPENLFESELFGHVKGAFTGADEARAGRFEVASGGTLFLDEIGNLPKQLQPKLLSALENRTVHRIGSNKPIDIDIRLICATNHPIGEMVEREAFRQDLLYRINTIEIELPPLRRRNDDIPQLARHFLAQYARKYQKEINGLSDGTLQKLQSYPWPGNVRELQHAIERAVIMSDHNILQPGDFLLSSTDQSGETLALSDYNLEEVEKTLIRKALDKHDDNISKTAEELGLTRASLYRRMDKYDIQS